MSVAPWLLERLVCPACRLPLVFREADELLAHDGGSCSEVYPVIADIPRLVLEPNRAALVRAHPDWFGAPGRQELASSWRSADGPSVERAVVAGFDYEWSRFADVGTPELGKIASGYFDQIAATLFSHEEVVLDAGCGAGRWAYEVASRGARVIALDLGQSIEIASRNTRSLGSVACVQADVQDLPFGAASLDWAYSLGVIHHVARPERAVSELARVVRPDGLVLIYLYYALDGRGRIFQGVFRAVDLVRQLSSRAPRIVTFVIAYAVAALVYFPLARVSHHVSRVSRGLANAMPLSFYRELSFRTMLNDSLDRFGTRVEGRYTREAFVALLRAAGLRDIGVSDRPPFWHGTGIVGDGPRP